MTVIHVHVDVPFCTKTEFRARTGMSEGTLNDKISKGEIPVIKTNLHEAKAGAVYVNLVKLAEMAASSPFEHPRFQTSTKRMNRK